MLFASVQKKEPDLESLHSRIESGSIGEAEYESLYDQHFPSDHSQDGGNLIPFFFVFKGMLWACEMGTWCVFHE